MWDSYWHTDGQSGLILKQATQIYLFTVLCVECTLVNQKLTTICLCEKSQLSSPAWHTKFSFMVFPAYNIQTWMWSTLHSFGVYDQLYFIPTLSSTSPWHTADRIDFHFSGHQVIFLCYGFVFFRTASSPFINLLVLCPKTAPCPEAAAQATRAATAADQAADHCEAFPKPLRAGFSLAAISTRSEWGANAVRTRSEIKF